MNGLHLGGKERRMLELMKGLKLKKDVEFELALMNREISYPEIFEMDVRIHYLIRKTKKDFSIFRKFYKLCKEYRPDIVHCWDSMTAFYAIPACKILNIKLMNGMVVDTPVKQNILNKNWFRARLTFPFSDVIIGNSKAGLAGYRAPHKKSTHIYNGLDLERFRNLKDPNIVQKEILGENTDNFLIIGMVAAFEERKDYYTFIKAAISLLHSNDNLRFILVGGGALLNESKQLVPNTFSEKIVFLGKQKNVESIINIFDIGVLLTNSKLHGEGISNSIIEYMAMGKPVIATSGGGTNEVVHDSENGFLIEPFNEEQLIAKTKILVENKKLRTDMGENGKEFIRKEFDLKIMTSKYFSMYDHLKNVN